MPMYKRLSLLAASIALSNLMLAKEGRCEMVHEGQPNPACCLTGPTTNLRGLWSLQLRPH